jgi:hypothetical protein
MRTLAAIFVAVVLAGCEQRPFGTARLEQVQAVPAKQIPASYFDNHSGDPSQHYLKLTIATSYDLEAYPLSSELRGGTCPWRHQAEATVSEPSIFDGNREIKSGKRPHGARQAFKYDIYVPENELIPFPARKEITSEAHAYCLEITSPWMLIDNGHHSSVFVLSERAIKEAIAHQQTGVPSAKAGKFPTPVSVARDATPP